MFSVLRCRNWLFRFSVCSYYFGFAYSPNFTNHAVCCADEQPESHLDIKSPSKADRYKAASTEDEEAERDRERKEDADAQAMALPVEVILDDTEKDRDRESKGDRPIGADEGDIALVSRGCLSVILYAGNILVLFVCRPSYCRLHFGKLFVCRLFRLRSLLAFLRRWRSADQLLTITCAPILLLDCHIRVAKFRFAVTRASIIFAVCLLLSSWVVASNHCSLFAC